MDRQPKKPGVAFWMTVVVVALVLYGLSFGPAMWLIDVRQKSSRWPIRVYWPLGKLAVEGPVFIRRPLAWYARAFAPKRPVLDFDGYLVPVGPNQVDLLQDNDP